MRLLQVFEVCVERSENGVPLRLAPPAEGNPVLVSARLEVAVCPRFSEGLVDQFAITSGGVRSAPAERVDHSVDVAVPVLVRECSYPEVAERVPPATVVPLP